MTTAVTTVRVGEHATTIVSTAAVGPRGPKGDPGDDGADLTAELAQEVADRQDGDAGLLADLAAEIEAREDADALLIPLTQKGAASGVATLDGDGKIPAAQIPALALSEFLGSVNSQAAMLALVGQRGDWTVRTDLTPNRVFILESDDPTQLANWTDITTPGAVITVAGRTGAITLTAADITDFAAQAIDAVDGTYQPVMASASQAEMEAGTEAALRAMSPLRVAQAIAALAAGGGLTQEQVEDLVALLIDDNSDLDWTYDDALASLVAVIKAGAVTNAMLAGSIDQAKVTNLVSDLAGKATAAQGAAADAAKAKTDHLTVTQAVDLDAIETRVNGLDAAVVLKGTWDASAGTFPGGGTAQAGDSWIVSVAGTVDGQVFVANDRIVAIADNASTGTYAANWHKLDYTDAVLSVAGLTGAISAAGLKTALAVALADITDASANGRSFVGAANYAAMKTLLALVKGDVGLGNVDNTSDANKPVSTATQSALDAKAPATRTVGTALGTTGAVTLDMAALHGTIQTITLTGNPTFSTSNRAAGRELTLILAAGGSTRTITWPSWLAVGAALPTSLASGKTMVVSVTFTDTTDAAAIVASSTQP